MPIQAHSDLRINHFSTIAAAMTIALSLQGCALVRDQAQVDPIVASQARWGGHGQPEPVIPDCLISDWVKRAAEQDPTETHCSRSIGSAPKPVPATKSVKERTSTELTSDEITLPKLSGNEITRRTQAQAELMTYADQVCDDHIAGIYAKNASFNLGFGLLTTLFSGGAAIASGRAATNLAAESALFSGSRSLINSEVYYGYIGPAVMREILSMRSDLRTQITAKRSCSLNEYPPQEAIDDALTYHNACSFSTGLASLLSKAGTTRVGEDKLRTAQLAMIKTQLAEKKAEHEKNKQPTDKDHPGASKEDKDRLSREIESLEAVQRFAATVDPEAGQPILDQRQKELAAANSDAAQKSQAYEAAKKAIPPDKELAAKQKAFEDADRKRKDLEKAVSATNIEFGVQACGPIKIPTMH